MLMLEERVDRLEDLMAEVNHALLRLERNMGIMQEESRRDREESRRDREESRRLREAFEKDREEARRERRELARQLGDISNKLGTIVEDIIAPSLRRMAQSELHCDQLETFSYRVEKYHPLTSRRREFDVIAVGSKAVLLNQTKATDRPEYAGRPLIPVFSSLHLPEDIVTYLTRQKVYAVGMGEETMEVLNLEQMGSPSG